MKKTMLAISALSAAVAFQASADGIVSSSVVGYNKAATVATENIYRVATFEGVSGTASTFKVGDISVGSVDFAYYNNDYIATVDPYGSQDAYYTWDPDANEGAGGWFECDEFCVVDDSSPADDVELPLNQAIIIRSEYGVDLTFSGAVMAGDTELYGVATENTYTGNFTPTTITLGDIVIGGADYAYYNNDYIATIDPYGSQDQYYTWDPDANEGAGGWFECDEFCTVDYGAEANDVEFDPNMGFLFRTENGVSINIPSPL